MIKTTIQLNLIGLKAEGFKETGMYAQSGDTVPEESGLRSAGWSPQVKEKPGCGSDPRMNSIPWGQEPLPVHASASWRIPERVR